MAGTILVTVVFFAAFITSVCGSTCDACTQCSISNIEILHNLIDARVNATATARIEEFDATIGERFDATVDKISSINTTLSALNATVDEKMKTAGTMVDAHDITITYLLNRLELAMIYISLSGNPRTVRMRRINTVTQEVGDVISTLTILNPLYSYTNNALVYRPYQAHTTTAILFVNIEVTNPCNTARICHLFTYGNDNFQSGRPFVKAGDVNNWHLFGSNRTPVVGFGVVGCPTFDLDCVSDFEISLVCLLPPDNDQCQ